MSLFRFIEGFILMLTIDKVTHPIDSLV